MYSCSDSSPVGLSSTLRIIPASPGRRTSSFEMRTRSPTRKRDISELYNGATGGISLEIPDTAPRVLEHGAHVLCGSKGGTWVRNYTSATFRSTQRMNHCRKSLLRQEAFSPPRLLPIAIRSADRESRS